MRKALIILSIILFASGASRAAISTTTNNIDTNFNAANSCIAVDLDQDGDIDIVATANNADATVDLEWWENDGAENFTERNIDVDFNQTNHLQVLDLDQDGDMDIVATRNNNDNAVADLSWWENNGSETFTEADISLTFNGANSLFTSDIDSDGDIDIIATNNNADNTVDIAYWLNDADRESGNIGFEGEHKLDDYFNGASSAYAIDIDMDGDIDVLGSASIHNDLAWWENNGSALDGTWTEHSIDSEFNGAYDIIAADIDMDGDMDLVAAGSSADEVAWWQNRDYNTQSFDKTVIENNFNSANDLTLIDLDTDGDLDIVATAGLDNDLAWWANGVPAGGGWTRNNVDTEFNGAYGAFCSDLDSDGDMDIVAVAKNADDLAWYSNNNQVFTKASIDDNFNGASAVTAGDLDSDGDIDVIACADNGDTVAWWANDGNGADIGWTKYIVDGDFGGASDIDILDMDLDGDMDIVASAKLHDDITWWENDATPQDGGWTEHAIDTDFDGAASVFAIDLNLDGLTDIVAAAESGDDISWFENGGAGAVSTPSDTGAATPSINVDFTTLTAPTHTLETSVSGLGSDGEETTTEEEYEEVDVKCFIATAAFGTPYAGEIKRLCAFRDDYLLKTKAGQSMVRLYYYASPPLARIVSKNDLLKTVVRVMIRICLKVIPV